MSIGKIHAFWGSDESNIVVISQEFREIRFFFSLIYLLFPYSQNCGSGGGGVIPGRDGNFSEIRTKC